MADDVYISLTAFAEEWEDDLLNLTQDALSPTSETSTERIHEFAQAIIEDIAGTMPKYHPNPVNTAAWNIGFIQAVTVGADWKEAESSAWDAWRREMDERAAQKYDAILQQTGNRKKAMAAFWQNASSKVPRPQEKIKAIARNKYGLVLESGLQVNWTLVATKIQKNELDLSGS